MSGPTYRQFGTICSTKISPLPDGRHRTQTGISRPLATGGTKGPFFAKSLFLAHELAWKNHANLYATSTLSTASS